MDSHRAGGFYVCPAALADMYFLRAGMFSGIGCGKHPEDLSFSHLLYQADIEKVIVRLRLRAELEAAALVFCVHKGAEKDLRKGKSSPIV